MVNVTLDKTSAPNAVTVAVGGTASSILVGTDVSQDFTEVNVRYNDVIVVPQTVAAGTTFITLQLSEGIELAYLLPKDTTFESNKKYTYHITVSRTEVKISTIVEDWIPGGVVTGEVGDLVH